MPQSSEAFEAERATGEPAFKVDLDGFEGPLDLLLELARRQKVDLAKISILELANQYLAFIEAARRVRLELAADYLVMAAWLAFLKSRLLLPEPPKAEAMEAAGMAEELARRLRILEDIRRAAQAMMERPQLGRDFFLRGTPEGVVDRPKVVYEASLYDLLSSYARQAQKRARSHVRMKPREVWSLADARDALTRMIGDIGDWTALDGWILEICVDPKLRRSARASSFSASLEMVREGLIELRQEAAFAPLYIRPVRPEPSGKADSAVATA
jgi:segregation and condensation protein A